MLISYQIQTGSMTWPVHLFLVKPISLVRFSKLYWDNYNFFKIKLITYPLKKTKNKKDSMDKGAFSINLIVDEEPKVDKSPIY